MGKLRDDRVLVTANRSSPVWDEARADARAAFLPFAAREMVEGSLEVVVLRSNEWAALQSFLASLPSGRTSLGIAVTDPPPEEPPEVSERAVAAGKLAELIRLSGATSPFGAEVLRETTGKYYAVAFSRGPEVCGQVFVYSPDYVRVALVAAGLRPPDGLPAQDSRIFESVDHAAKFLALILGVGSGRIAQAMAIPLRQPRRKPK